MKSLIRFFNSVKLAIVLLIIITIASMLGTLIPQQRSAAEYAARYGELSSVLIRLEFTKLYHSWWYISLLLLLTLNILVCSLTRLSPKFRKAFRPRLETETKNLLALKINERFKKNWNLGKTKQEFSKILSSKHYRTSHKNKENRIFLHARKKILGLFGSDIVHLGLLIILLGGIISGLSGFKTNLSISVGQILPVPNADFKVKLDKFETEYYPNGSVKDWKSKLSVIENEKSILTKTIEVNHPLSYKGFVFYQSSYGWDWKDPSLEIWVKKREDASFLKKAFLKVGEKMKMEDEAIELSVLSFFPDFILNEKNEAVSRSMEPNNPAAFIQGTKDGEEIFSGWIFANFPDFARIHSKTETDLSFELKDFKATQYSGLQVAKDPGVNIIWIGCVVLMIGLFIAFYWPPREIKIVLEESQGKTEVFAGGIASKFRDSFQSEFENIMTSVRRQK